LKSTQKIGNFIAAILLTVTSSAHSMKEFPLLSQVRNQINSLVEPITQFFYKKEDFLFVQLPLEMQQNIALLACMSHTDQFMEVEDGFTYGQEYLDDLAYTVNALARVDKTRFKLLNEPVFCLQLIKTLAAREGCSDMVAATALKLPEVRRRLEMQAPLKSLCWGSCLSRATFDGLCSQGVDLEFSYSCSTNTKGWMSPLMLAAKNNNHLVIDWLLEKKVNVNQANGCGTTAVMCAGAGALSRIIAAPCVNINQQDVNGDTALMYRFKMDQPCLLSIKNLLNAGADPQLKNNDSQTALTFAKQYAYLDPFDGQKIVNVLECAIAKNERLLAER